MRTARGFASDAIFPEKLAGLLARLDPGGGEHLRLAALAAAQSVVRGDVCADLRSLSGAPVPNGGAFPSFAEWVEELSKSPVVGRPGDFRPLVIDGAGRLYLYGYHRRESFVAGEISRKALFDFPAGRECELSAALASLFGKSSDSPDLQRVAALNSALRRFSVISGGPGTGKTYTVARAAALLLMVYGENLKMAVCAPTGKAAGRLGEALSGAVESLECPEWVKERLPREVFTIHRLLGMGREGERFRFNANNPLPHDVVVVDEASMVDLTLMADLFAALGRDARVILSGDRDQLSSVEAGALLGDIASVPEAAAYSPQAASFIKEAAGDEVNLCSLPSSPLRDSVTILEKSRRFSSASAIGRAARAILTGGECDEAYRLLGGVFGGSREFGEMLAEKALAGYELLLEASSPVEALSALNSFRVLCAVRKGPRGVEALNLAIERALARRGLIPEGREWYSGRPVMVTVNDYSLGLMNGDVGVAHHGGGKELRVWFETGGGVRSFSPARLANIESVYAMTVHKSQGSEFRGVWLVLPDSAGEMVTRELLYTAVTRAKEEVSLWASPELFAQGAQRVTARSSGLKDALF